VNCILLYVFPIINGTFYCTVCIDRHTGEATHKNFDILIRSSFCIQDSMWPAARSNFARLRPHHIRVRTSQFHSLTPTFITAVNAPPCHKHFLQSDRRMGVTEPTKCNCNAFHHESVRLGFFPFLLEKGKLKKLGGRLRGELVTDT
jgi:hypothetical protein